MRTLLDEFFSPVRYEPVFYEVFRSPSTEFKGRKYSVSFSAHSREELVQQIKDTLKELEIKANDDPKDPQ